MRVVFLRQFTTNTGESYCYIGLIREFCHTIFEDCDLRESFSVKLENY
jgi:hypothetical protein